MLRRRPASYKREREIERGSVSEERVMAGGQGREENFILGDKESVEILRENALVRTRIQSVDGERFNLFDCFRFLHL